MSDSEEAFQPLSDVTQHSEEKEIAIILTKDKVFFEKYLADVESQTFDILEKLSEDDFLANAIFQHYVEDGAITILTFNDRDTGKVRKYV